jgi:hypothetical protein
MRKSAAYFTVAVEVAVEHGHYISVPFLLLFLFGFGYVGTVSASPCVASGSARRARPRFPW